ncbi:MAG: enoyl-CoA hydratase [Rhodobacteraceae bacterium]|nr:enoyl-CoA hydratase [Paracoccaceae bacterium]
MAGRCLLIDRDGPVATVTLNVPERLNVLSEEMLGALQSALDDLGGDPAVRCVVLGAAGSIFCAGHDLREMTEGRQAADGGKAYFADIFARCARMMMTIQAIPKPVIARVQGAAVAAGCQLVASCDMAVVARGGRFGVNGVNIGLFCSTPMVALTRSVGQKHAFEMLTTGRIVEAEEAESMGLVNEVVEQEMLDQRVSELAGVVASKLSTAVTTGKQAFYQQAGMSLEEAYRFTGDVMVRNMLNHDTEEGISAFLEKRPPAWADQRL